MSEFESSSPDRAIGDREESVDVTPEEAVKAESFDFEAWLSGTRPAQRAVKLNGRGDLVAVMESAALRYEDGDAAAEAEYEQAKAAFLAANRIFVVQAMSSEAVDAVRARQAEALGKTVEEAEDDEAAGISLFMAAVAAHVVTPAGFDLKAMERLDEVAPSEALKLLNAVNAVDRQSPTSVKVASPDFSLRR